MFSITSLVLGQKIVQKNNIYIVVAVGVIIYCCLLFSYKVPFMNKYYEMYGKYLPYVIIVDLLMFCLIIFRTCKKGQSSDMPMSHQFRPTDEQIRQMQMMHMRQQQAEKQQAEKVKLLSSSGKQAQLSKNLDDPLNDEDDKSDDEVNEDEDEGEEEEDEDEGEEEEDEDEDEGEEEEDDNEEEEEEEDDEEEDDKKKVLIEEVKDTKDKPIEVKPQNIENTDVKKHDVPALKPEEVD